MGLLAAHYTIGTVAAKVVESYRSPQLVTFHNHEHSSNSDIYINGPGVTINNGLHLSDTETIQLSVPAGDEVWAISDTTGNELHVLTQRM